MYKYQKFLICFISVLILVACASPKPQYRNIEHKNPSMPKEGIDRTFYLVGDAGVSPWEKMSKGLTAFKSHIEGKDTSKDFVLFLGDNIYPVGLPDSLSPLRVFAENHLNAQINAIKEFEGYKIFIPGNHDWYSYGLAGLERQKQYLVDAIGEDAFLPEDGCPLKSVDVSDEIQLIILDTQWYLENWDHHPTINDDCEIKTRERFFEEVEGELKKAGGKTIILAMHHPMYTNGTHGGNFAPNKHLYPMQKKIPMPILASLVMQIRTQGGVSIQDRYNERYNDLMKRLNTLTIDSGNIILVSGHEHTLQYLESEDGIKQVVSGSASKTSAAALKKNGWFTTGGYGFAEFTIFDNGSSWITIYGEENGKAKLLFQKEVYPPKEKYDYSKLPDNFPTEIEASIYTKQETDVSSFYESILGDRYRDVYSTKITVPVATLDTLYGGLEVVRAGGGHQTRSLRLKRKDGRELNMRALRKSATQYIQKVLFKESYVEDKFEKTAIEDLILDFYTAAHPYAFLTIPDLSKAADLYHTNPKIFYVPKHKALGEYNEEYGDELYMIVERPEENYTNERSFGYADDIESTHDIIEKIREDEKYKIDENKYIRARLFDMLVGDWDRHQDQWRWAQDDQPNGDKVFRPIPRDRDQVFSNFDGALLNLMRAISGSTKQLQVYDEELKDIEWINAAGVKLDRVLVQQSELITWQTQAEFLMTYITDDVIEKAFNKIPEEVQDETILEIKEKLKGRRGNLKDIAERYYEYLSSLVILTGTDKDDYIEVLRAGQGRTRVIISRIKDGIKADTIVDRTFHKKLTKNIWIYGLDDDDIFEVREIGKPLIYTRLIGGLGNDTYRVHEGKRVKIYDHYSKENTFEVVNGGRIRETDVYNLNLFDFNKNIKTAGGISPNAGYNPDDGVFLGLELSKRRDGFQRNPFSQLHVINGLYAFETHGLDINYRGEFANIFEDWNLEIGGNITNNNFTQNFFGFGNETINRDDELDFDFNRVRMSMVSAYGGILKKADFGSDYGFRAVFDGVKVLYNENRFLAEIEPVENTSFYDRMFFGAVEAEYKYHSADNENTPTQGMDFMLNIGGRTNLEDIKNVYGYLNTNLQFFNALTLNKKLVLRTNVRYKLRVGQDFLFYQAASLGGDTGLRGYRNERFTGKASLVAGGDLRYAFGTIKTKTFPFKVGIFGGGDLGKVWIRDVKSDVWHNDYGGGIWVTAAELLSGYAQVFTGDEGARFVVGLGVNF